MKLLVILLIVLPLLCTIVAQEVTLKKVQKVSLKKEPVFETLLGNSFF